MVVMKGQTLVAILTMCVAPAFSQQTYVTRYDFSAGYTFLDSPHLGLLSASIARQIADAQLWR
jgi:hypothetical protein